MLVTTLSEVTFNSTKLSYSSLKTSSLDDNHDPLKALG